MSIQKDKYKLQRFGYYRFDETAILDRLDPFNVVFFNITANATFNLPAMGDICLGYFIFIKREDTNADFFLTILPHAGTTINGMNELILSAAESVCILADNKTLDWTIVVGYNNFVTSIRDLDEEDPELPGQIVFNINNNVYNGIGLYYSYNNTWIQIITDETTLPGEITGDERAIAGLGYTHGNPTGYPDIPNAGEGTVTLSSAGNNLTITCAITNPDFELGEIVPGDKIIVINTAGVITNDLTITAVNNNVLTLNAAPPTVNNYGACVMFKPNETLDESTLEIYKGVPGFNLAIQGFYFEPTKVIELRNVQTFIVRNCLINCVPGNTQFLRLDPVTQGNQTGLQVPGNVVLDQTSYIIQVAGDLFFSSRSQVSATDLTVYTNNRNGMRFDGSDAVLNNITVFSRNNNGRLLHATRGTTITLEASVYLLLGQYGIVGNSSSNIVFRTVNTNALIKNLEYGIWVELFARMTSGFGEDFSAGFIIDTDVTTGVIALRGSSVVIIEANVTNNAVTPYNPAAAGVIQTLGEVIYRG